MVANSVPIRPMPNSTTACTSAGCSGVSDQRPAAPSTYSPENSQIQPMRRPDPSATAPRIGASTAISTPVIDSPYPHSACAFAPAMVLLYPSAMKWVFATSAK